ncbi:MAG: hypothetical protein Q8K63_14585 [Acidimicrobiales bacterium]|nr:hypothetical protein [Acidimicrobiales bacterium]
MSTLLSTRVKRVGLSLGAVAAAVSLVVGVAIAATPFTDINGNPHAADIDATYNAGIVTGCDATRYCPSDPVKRDQLAGFLARTAGLSTSAAKRFPVVNARSTAQTYCSLHAASPRSFDAGPCQGTAVDVDTAPTVGLHSSVAMGADGLPVMSYFDAKNGDLRVARCAQAACTAGATIATVDAAGVVGRYSSIAIGADGLPLISYYDATNGDLKVAHCVNLACAGNVTTSTVDSAGDVGQFSALTIGADGIGVIAYFDATNGDLKVARCTATACTVVTKAVLDAGGVVGQHASIALGADNVPAIAYFDATRSRLKFTRCSDASCKGGASTVTLDPTSIAGQFSSIAVGIDGMPVIAYYDAGATDLKVLRCGNTLCSIGITIVAVDISGDVGKFASIAIGTDGRPVVAAYRVDGANLRFARCLNAACSSSVVRTIDANGDVGSNASITVAPDGVPVVSYHDAGRGVLRVARPPAA